MFRRGFVEGLKLRAPFVDRVERTMFEMPLRALARVKATAEDAPRLAALDGPPSLQAVALRANDGRAAVALATSPAMRAVRVLDLRDCELRDQVLLASATGLPALEELDLGGNFLQVSFLEAFVGAPRTLRLRTQRFDGCYLGDEGARLLARGGAWEMLRVLGLRSCRLEDGGISRLVSSNGLRALTHLDLSWNTIGDEGARALIATRRLPHLVELDVRNCKMSAENVAELHKRYGARLIAV